MEEQIDKTTLLDKIRTEYAVFERLLAPLDEKQMTTAGINGEWSIKDVLAHITAWQQRLFDLLQAAIHGKEPAISASLNDEKIDRLNEQFYEKNKSRSLAQVLADFQATYLQVIEMVQTMTNEDLTDPTRFAWMNGRPIWSLVAGDTYEHYQEHAGPIQEWLAKC